MNDLSVASRAQKSPDVLFRNLSGEAVLLNLATGNYFGLDPVGTRIWEILETRERLQDVIEAIVQEFDVDEATARRDLFALVSELEAKGLIHVQGGAP
ncbi:MAG: PqqD family protein [Acidobacteria bacterium]|nr:PqqD family protein [Acidobacteriota bacterium]